MQKQNVKFPGTAWLNDKGKLRQLVLDMWSQVMGRKILDARRQRAARLFLLGLSVTGCSIALDSIGLLKGMENFFYDNRAYYFQFTTPSPTARLVHLDIDESVVKAVNTWPFPRRLMADFVKEIGRAEPKVLFLDIIFSEPDKQDPEGDRLLAEAFSETKGVLVPISLGLKTRVAMTPLHQRMIQELKQELSIEEEELARRLGQMRAAVKSRVSSTTQPASTTQSATQPSGDGDLEERPSTEFSSFFIEARRQAASESVASILREDRGATIETLRRRLLPNLPPSIKKSPILDVLADSLNEYQQKAAAKRFTRFTQPEIPQLLSPDAVAAPLVKFADAAATSGFVDYVEASDGDSKVRFVPLWVNFDGAMLPHVSVAMACAFRGLSISEVQFYENKVVFPASPGFSKLEVPVRTLHRENRESVPLVADIPWFGGRKWEAMYDVPEHKSSKQHLSLRAVLNVIEARQLLEQNSDAMMQIIEQYLGPIDLGLVEELKGKRKLPPEEFRMAVMEKWDTICIPYVQMLSETPPNQRDKPELWNTLIENFEIVKRNLNLARDQHERFQKQLVKEQKKLRLELGGKVVLMGFTATGTMDFYPTAIHTTAPGVVAHGALVNGFLTGHFWGRAPVYVTQLLTLALGILTTLLVVFATPWKSAVGAASVIAGYILLNGLVLFDYNNLVVGVAGPMTAMGLCWGSVTLFRFIGEIRERNRIQQRFSNYVDPELVNYVVENPEEAAFAGREKEATVVFTDLEGFTTLSERLGASVVSILNDYVARMTPIIRRNRGFIDKFLGDGIMFEFNAVRPNPGHATDALNAVIAMQAEMLRINVMLTENGLPTLRMRVGVNTGSMIVGDAGGGGASNFTVLGDNVNLAARLESANKAFGTLMLMTQATLDQTGGRFAVRPVARLVVKGKENAVMTYEPLGLASEVTEEQKRLVALSQAIFDAYIAGEFQKCMTACDAMTAALGETKFAKIYHKESLTLLAEGAGPDFDGTVTLSEK